jgi:subfamily B ATP-binding cassette protein MsbA
MISRQDLRSATGLLNRFLRPYWKGVMAVVLVNVLVGALTAVRPLVAAPAFTSVLTAQQPAAAPAAAADVSAPAAAAEEPSSGETPTAKAEQPRKGFLNKIGPDLIKRFGLADASFLTLGLTVAVLYLSVTVAIAFFGFIGHVWLVRTRTAVMRDLTTTLHRHLLTLPLRYFQGRRAGDLVSRLTNDVTRTSNSMDGIVRGLLKSLAQISITLSFLVATDAGLALALLGLGAVHFTITRVLGTRVRRASRDAVDKLGKMGASLLETFIGIRIIKSFAAERFDAKRVYAAADELRRNLMRFRIVTYYETPVRMVADAFVLGTVVVLAFYAVQQGRLTWDGAALFFYLAQQLTAPISEFFGQFLSIQNMLGGASEIISMFKTESAMKDGDKPAHDLESNIVFEGVNFSYDEERYALKDVNLEIARGEFVGVVGPSGAGKSTLTDLVLRLYDVTSGRILYDGVDIRDFRQREYRRRFGVVAQECLLFNATVRENIVYNREDNEDDLRHALWAANAEEFVSELPQGLDTFVGDRGVRLSGGQRQRIAIARAIYNRPSLLILDEATSALDSEAERSVQEAIDRISKEMTLIVVAHRLSTIVHADNIIVLSRGSVEAVGDHHHLLRSSSTYHRLYQLQTRQRKLRAEGVRP